MVCDGITKFFLINGFVQKVNRTGTPSHCTCVFRYKLHKNYPKEGFAKKNDYLFTKEGIRFITTKTRCVHSKVL